MMDLIYFGDGIDAQNARSEFISQIKEKFIDVRLENADDDIKGLREEVYLEDIHKKDYLSWLIGVGWLKASLNMQILLMSKDRETEMKEIWELAKTQYPEQFEKVK